MISRNELKALLDRLSPSRWCATDFRRLADGRLVRFVAWRKGGAA